MGDPSKTLIKTRTSKRCPFVSIDRRGLELSGCDLHSSGFILLSSENYRLKESNFSRFLPLNPKRGFSLIFQGRLNGNFCRAHNCLQSSILKFHQMLRCLWESGSKNSFTKNAISAYSNLSICAL